MFSDLSENWIESTDVVGGRCMQENNETLYLNENDRAKLWKAHMSKIMNSSIYSIVYVKHKSV